MESPLSRQPQENQQPYDHFLSTARYGRVLDAENDTFEIEGEVWKAGHIIGEGRDLTDKERRVAKKYLTMRSLLHEGSVSCCCHRKDALPLDPETGFPDADIHHFRRLANGRRVHILKDMAWANHNHNSEIGRPAVVIDSRIGRERESATDILTETQKQSASAEVRINIDIYPVFCRWLDDETDQKRKISVKDAISGGAMFMRKQTGHGSPQSARNYLDMVTSKEGGYEIIDGYVVRRQSESRMDKQPLPPEPPTL